MAHRFAEFADKEDSATLDGDKVPIASVFNIPIVIKAVRVRNSKYAKGNSGRQYAMFQFNRAVRDEHGDTVEVSKKNEVTTTGSEVLINQLEKYEKEMPFETVIVKIDKYFTLT